MPNISANPIARNGMYESRIVVFATSTDAMVSRGSRPKLLTRISAFAGSPPTPAAGVTVFSISPTNLTLHNSRPWRKVMGKPGSTASQLATSAVKAKKATTRTSRNPQPMRPSNSMTWPNSMLASTEASRPTPTRAKISLIHGPDGMRMAFWLRLANRAQETPMFPSEEQRKQRRDGGGHIQERKRQTHPDDDRDSEHAVVRIEAGHARQFGRAFAFLPFRPDDQCENDHHRKTRHEAEQRRPPSERPIAQSHTDADEDHGIAYRIGDQVVAMTEATGLARQAREHAIRPIQQIGDDEQCTAYAGPGVATDHTGGGSRETEGQPQRRQLVRGDGRIDQRL